MDCGSKYVWMYDQSDEEFVSETELNEGMWLSLSEGEDSDEGQAAVPTLTPMATVHPNSKQAADAPLEGSTTKYLPLDDAEENQPGAVPSPPPAIPLPPPLPLRDEGSGNETENEDSGDDETPARKDPNYVTLQHQVETATGATATGATAIEPKIKSKIFKHKREHKKEDVEYVKISGPKTKAFSTPAQQGSPPPPPRPARGIIKNRLTKSGIKKVKKTRVNWPSDPSRTRRGGRVTRRADTNVLAVKFNTLVEPSDVHTGDSVVCINPNCTAILSHLSSIKDHEDPDKDEKIWECEFCGTTNEVDIVPEEMPTKEDTTFMIAPAQATEGVAQGGGVEDSLVMFCIDVSGSMCVTTEVPGKFELKGHDRVRGLSSLNVQNENQYMPGQSRNNTYVSRLQGVQAAVDHQLTLLAGAHPTNKVALVTFGDEVTVVGDGRSTPVTMAGDKLWSVDALVKLGKDVPMPGLIKDTHKKLSKTVFDLEESGQTALGPALLLSISMAARIPGSKVIICTDGLANRGVGNLDDLVSAEARGEAQTFYENMGTLAVEKNVTVSLVRIRATDCKATELGQVADKTGGQVTTVNPLNITKEFTSILANPVIATNVRAKIVLHSELYFRSEDSQESMLLIPVGNVTADTELTYEYGSRTKKNRPSVKGSTGGYDKGDSASGASPKVKRLPPLQINGKDHLPFQLQIEYTGKDGSRCVRVISQAKPVTRDRDIAERGIDMGVVGSHVARNTAKLTMEGEYTGARVNALSNQRLLQRNSHWTDENRHAYTNVMEDIIPLERKLASKQMGERDQFRADYSDDDNQYDVMYDQETPLMATELAVQEPRYSAPRMKSVPKTKKAVNRRGEMEDDLAVYLYNMKATKSSDYTELHDYTERHDNLHDTTDDDEDED